MAVLIVEHSGKRERASLNGRASIGRTTASDIVIEHPAVSRNHALIECISGTYFITDNGSKNGTTLGDSPLLQKRQLQDGDRISIGPAVITFHTGDDPVVGEGHTSPTETHAGMLMECECGAQLWVPKEMIGGRGQCQNCGRTIPLGQPKSTAPQTCSICQWNIGASDERLACPSCGLVFHKDCWEENRGCSAYGCSEVNALDKPAEVEAAMEEIGHPPIVVPPQKFPWEFALLAGSVIASLLGVLLFGALALLTLLCSGFYLLKHGRKTRVAVLLATMCLSLAGLIAGVVISCFWWLNLSLHR